jgi:hypothetical protein
VLPRGLLWLGSGILTYFPFAFNCDAESLAGNYPYAQGRLTHRRLPSRNVVVPASHPISRVGWYSRCLASPDLFSLRGSHPLRRPLPGSFAYRSVLKWEICRSPSRSVRPRLNIGQQATHRNVSTILLGLDLLILLVI